MPRVALHFQDGFTRIIEVWHGETLANAAYRQKINIPLDCANGVCGTCKCRVKSGEFTLGNEYLEEALSPSEAADGLALACQMVAKTDLLVEVFATAKACKVQPETYSTTITRLDFLSPDIAKLTASHDNCRRPDYLPGQYANIEIPGTSQTRSFSFSTSGRRDHVEFIVRLLPTGTASNYFRQNARAGEKLKLNAPFGSFYLRPLNAPTLFFAGGTGIAPFLAMLDSLAGSANKVSHPITLFYGATCDANAVELSRLDAFKSKLRFDYHVCISGEPSRKFRPGFVTQWITREHITGSNYDAYVCGPPPMVDAVRSAFNQQGISLSNFHAEKFAPSGAP